MVECQNEVEPSVKRSVGMGQVSKSPESPFSKPASACVIGPLYRCIVEMHQKWFWQKLFIQQPSSQYVIEQQRQYPTVSVQVDNISVSNI